MNPEPELRTVVSYLDDMESDLEKRANDPDPRARTHAREDMRHALGRAREAIARLEQIAPDVATVHQHDGQEVAIDLEEARIWCHIIEPKIMGICYEDSASAARWMEKAIAIDPGRARNHALLALFLSDAGDHQRARDAIDRAIDLDPDEVQYRKIRDQVVRHDQKPPDPTPDYPWWHLGKYVK